MILRQRLIAFARHVGSGRLPFGAVMATGAATQVARVGPLRALSLPLLLLTLGEALILACCFLARWWALRSAPAEGAHLDSSPRWHESPERQFGLFTVPVGCAVIATGFIAAASPVALFIAVFALAVSVLSVAALGGSLGGLLLLRKPGPRAPDGSWFLAPAAALAIAIALAALVPRLPLAERGGMRLAALVWCAIGIAGYGATLALVAVRVYLAGIGAVERAPWWISAGCGGLAAAAAGRVAGTLNPSQRLIHSALAWAALITWAIGSALLAPIIMSSIASLLADRWPPRVPPWFPTFSTGVYALGSDLVGSLWHLQAIAILGQVAGVATVALWATTSALMARQMAQRAPVTMLT